MHSQGLTSGSRRCSTVQRPQQQQQAFTTRRPVPSRPARQQRLHVCNMFTGIVQGMATVETVQRSDNFSSLVVGFPQSKVDGIQIGARWESAR